MRPACRYVATRDRPYPGGYHWSDHPAGVTQYRFGLGQARVDCDAMRRQAGYSMSELFVVMAIVAILLGIGV
ncbi:MAG: prepilin-type N-terminal cleavage/methylation domain-containing protein, partial [Gammaproteobacteria bacterium]|nr:prepilin-type N-terminal cleavage/methylation domain-containing protein [Gammaproteobacteria bacterium]